MNKPHKHAELIKAWADGAEIEILSKVYQEWILMPFPDWHNEMEYRIKPEQKPDVVRYTRITSTNNLPDITDLRFPADNLKLTFDGETGKLKSAEVINND